MADSLDEEEQNRLIGYMDLDKIDSEEEFWEEFNYTFKKKAVTKLGKNLLQRIKTDYGELPRKPKVKRTYVYHGISFKRETVYRKHHHYIAFRDIKTGRFVSVK
jgi:hypothetical protein